MLNLECEIRDFYAEAKYQQANDVKKKVDHTEALYHMTKKPKKVSELEQQLKEMIKQALSNGYKAGFAKGFEAGVKAVNG